MLKTISLVLLIGLCASSDTSSLLHRLFGKRSKSASPVVLILDKNTLRPLTDQQASRHSHVNYDSSEESFETLQHLIQHLSKTQRSKSHSHKHARSHKHSPRHAARDRMQEHEDKTRSRTENRVDELVAPKSMLRSPIYHSLLTLRNRLRCGARDECINECDDNNNDSDKFMCDLKCEKKYACKEEKRKEEDRQCETNSCEDSDEPMNNCDNDKNCEGSTKGILFEPEPVGCKRC